MPSRFSYEENMYYTAKIKHIRFIRTRVSEQFNILNKKNEISKIKELKKKSGKYS